MCDLSTRKWSFLGVQALTAARIPLALLWAGLLVGSERSPGLVVAGIVLLALIELSDLLDGLLARRCGVVSEWGALLDPYADSLSRLLIYWALAVEGLALAIVPLGLACRDLTVAYCRIVLVRYQETAAANWSGKLKAWVQGAGAFFLWLSPALGRGTVPLVSWIVFLVTLGSAVEYVRAAARAARRPRAAETRP